MMVENLSMTMSSKSKVGSDNVSSAERCGNAVLLKPKRKWLGVSGCKTFGSELMYVREPSFKTARISFIRVCNSDGMISDRAITCFNDIFVRVINISNDVFVSIINLSY